MTRRLARRNVGAVEVFPIGLGCAAFSLDLDGEPARASTTIAAALDAGVDLFDTALAYTTAARPHHNERMLREILGRSGAVDTVLVSTKGGHFRDNDRFPVDGRPATLRRNCESSLRALGVDAIDLYHLHWPDPVVPIQESVGALADLQREGMIRQIGVSNVDLYQLREAQRAATIASVQNRFSIYHRDGLDVIEHCHRTGTAFLAHSPLGGSRRIGADRAPGTIEQVAARHDATRAQVALAWLLAVSPIVIAIVGATRPQNIRTAAAAADLELTAGDIVALNDPARPGE
jgi:aryl-alcohol dehydrogenase-like predicted oxidoreductase